MKSIFNGLFFNDTDVYKWIEAVSYALFYFDVADLEDAPKKEGKKVVFKAIPYHAWANGKQGPMVVWFDVE